MVGKAGNLNKGKLENIRIQYFILTCLIDSTMCKTSNRKIKGGT